MSNTVGRMDLTVQIPNTVGQKDLTLHGLRYECMVIQQHDRLRFHLRFLSSSIQHFFIMITSTDHSVNLRMEFGSKNPAGIRPTCRMLRIDRLQIDNNESGLNTEFALGHLV